jgi:hypothetical protein
MYHPFRVYGKIQSDSHFYNTFNPSGLGNFQIQEVNFLPEYSPQNPQKSSLKASGCQFNKPEGLKVL